MGVIHTLQQNSLAATTCNQEDSTQIVAVVKDNYITQIIRKLDYVTVRIRSQHYWSDGDCSRINFMAALASNDDGDGSFTEFAITNAYGFSFIC